MSKDENVFLARDNIRPATLADLSDLLELEASFSSDQISRRGFRHLLAHGNATVLVHEVNGKVIANIVILYRRGFRSARIYSLIVATDYRKHGIARALLQAAEQAAIEHRCTRLHLELRPDNHAALHLYHSLSYEAVNTKPDYYQDHGAALCMRKEIAGRRIMGIVAPVAPVAR